MKFLNIIFNRRISLEMKPAKYVLMVLTACAVNMKQTCSFKVDTMDTFQTQIDLKDPSWPFYASGILKSHSGFYYTVNRNKTLILSAPKGYSIFAAIRLLDLRPHDEDYVTLFANGTAGPVKYSNSDYYQNRIFDVLEIEKQFYAPDGQLGVTFCTGPGSFNWGYEGFELIYTVQANFSRCGFDDFHCINGRCISKSFKCDGHNHCGDRSDQTDCFSPDPPQPPSSGRTVGITGGVVCLVIAVSCAIYIIIRRASRTKVLRRTVITQHPPPPNVQGYPPPYSESGSVYPPPPPPYTPYKQGITNPGYQ